MHVELCLYTPPPPPPSFPPSPFPLSRFLHVHHNREEDGQWGEGGVSQASLRQGVRGTPQTSFGFHVSVHSNFIIIIVLVSSILQTLYRQRDPHHKSVVKTRRCFLWNRQYFQLDIFTDCTDRYIITGNPFHPLFGHAISVAMLCCTNHIYPIDTNTSLAPHPPSPCPPLRLPLSLSSLSLLSLPLLLASPSPPPPRPSLVSPFPLPLSLYLSLGVRLICSKFFLLFYSTVLINFPYYSFEYARLFFL